MEEGGKVLQTSNLGLMVNQLKTYTGVLIEFK